MVWATTATTGAATAACCLLATSSSRGKRSYAERTAARRRRTQQLLESIRAPTSNTPLHDAANSISLLDAPTLDWSNYDELLDPQQGGKLQKDTPRSRRKRVQVEAFLHICRQLLQHDEQLTTSLVDAGSGAGNLAIPLSGILQRPVLAIDMNPVALQRLEDRAASTTKENLVSTLCTDLAATDSIVIPSTAGIVCSLHGCGAATDMAIRLATQRRIAFVMSPCCNGKANVQRPVMTNKHGLLDDDETTKPKFFPKHGAPTDISYPRSQWLHETLQTAEGGANHEGSTTTPEEFYVTLAKVADVGLGPQTPEEQRGHQRLAKYVVEMDRLMAVVQEYDYKVQLYRLKEHEGYGKAEIFVGIPNEHPAAAGCISMDSSTTSMDWMKDLSV